MHSMLGSQGTPLKEGEKKILSRWKILHACMQVNSITNDVNLLPYSECYQLMKLMNTTLLE